MTNGQGSGSTETGTYTLVGGQTCGNAVAVNPGATFYIPTENECYKAAYYSPNYGGEWCAGLLRIWFFRDFSGRVAAV
jgi:formylglycine-generating enzyme